MRRLSHVGFGLLTWSIGCAILVPAARGDEAVTTVPALERSARAPRGVARSTPSLSAAALVAPATGGCSFGRASGVASASLIIAVAALVRRARRED